MKNGREIPQYLIWENYYGNRSTDKTVFSDRNLEIYEKRKQGKSCRSIAIEYGLCAQRIDQICRKIDRRKRDKEKNAPQWMLEEKNLYEAIYSIPCDYPLYVANRVIRALNRDGIKTTEQIKALTEEQVMNMRNLGKTSWEFIKRIQDYM